jgi:aspartate/methionine/tyrosine aminotransferase
VKTDIDPDHPDHLSLANSGMPALTPKLSDLGISADELPLAGSNPYGFMPLREGIAQRYGLHPENVLTAQGTSAANFLLMSILLNPGDVLLIETPAYECLTYPAQALGVRIVPFERHADYKYQLDVSELTSLAHATGAAGILLTNPHNPSGMMVPDSDILQIAEGLGKEKFIIVDEVYRESWVNQAGRTVALRAPNLYVTSSLTKVWGLGNLRVGWALASHDAVKRAYHAYDHIGGINPFPTEWIGARIFDTPNLINGIREKAVSQIAAGRDHIDRFLRKRATGKRVKTVMPEGGGFAMWSIEGINGDAFAQGLYQAEGVIVTPGRFFGLPKQVRIAWTSGSDSVIQALHRLDRWLGTQG